MTLAEQAQRAMGKLTQYAVSSRAIRMERAEAQALCMYVDALEAEHAEALATERYFRDEKVARVEAENDKLRKLLDEVALNRAGIAGQLSATEKLLADRVWLTLDEAREIQEILKHRGHALYAALLDERIAETDEAKPLPDTPGTTGVERFA